MRCLAVVIIVMGTAGLAAADQYSCPRLPDDGLCPVEVTVPEGCPIHFLLAHGSVPADIRAMVTRGGTDVDVAGVPTTTTVLLPVRTKDKNSCFCDDISVGREFDEYTLPVIGVVAGESVDVWAPVAGPVTIGPPGPCPTFTYTANFEDPIACDLCPTPDDYVDHDDGLVGCSSAPAPSALLLLVAFVAIGVRRRVGPGTR